MPISMLARVLRYDWVHVILRQLKGQQITGTRMHIIDMIYKVGCAARI